MKKTKQTKAERMIDLYTFQYIKLTFKMKRTKKLKMKDAYHVFAVIRDHVRDEIEFYGGPHLD